MLTLRESCGWRCQPQLRKGCAVKAGSPRSPRPQGKRLPCLCSRTTSVPAQSDGLLFQGEDPGPFTNPVGESATCTKDTFRCYADRSLCNRNTLSYACVPQSLMRYCRSRPCETSSKSGQLACILRVARHAVLHPTQPLV